MIVSRYVKEALLIVVGALLLTWAYRNFDGMSMETSVENIWVTFVLSVAGLIVIFRGLMGLVVVTLITGNRKP